MFKVKYVDSIMMLVRLDLNLIVSLFQHKCEVSETVLTTTLIVAGRLHVIDYAWGSFQFLASRFTAREKKTRFPVLLWFFFEEQKNTCN